MLFTHDLKILAQVCTCKGKVHTSTGVEGGGGGGLSGGATIGINNGALMYVKILNAMHIDNFFNIFHVRRSH